VFALGRLPRQTSKAFVGLAVLGLAWLLVVAAMLQAGASSGIDRYLIVPLALEAFSAEPASPGYSSCSGSGSGSGSDDDAEGRWSFEPSTSRDLRPIPR
jgi:hypothetical protein